MSEFEFGQAPDCSDPHSPGRGRVVAHRARGNASEERGAVTAWPAVGF